MLAYLFPGQGSQARGMGKGLFEEFSDYTQQADELLGYSIQELCTKDRHEQLNQTQYTQPALYAVNALMYLKICADNKQKPDYVAGHSLGEYNALFAAGVFDFITGLALVKKRGELMSQAQGGAMAAIIGLEAQDITRILQEHELSTLTVANYNSYRQLVISGPKADMEQAQASFSTISAATFIPLKVSGAFHSAYMVTAQQAFAEFLKEFEFSTPSLPVIANINVAPYHPAIIKSNLINQITHPVKWLDTIEYLLKKPDMSLNEVGPGSVLSGLSRRISMKE